jgi:heme exporter protein D
MSAFLNMGGYAAYVWPAYGISALGLIAATMLTLRAYRKAKARLAALEGRKQ